MFIKVNFYIKEMSEIKALVEKYCDLDDYIRLRNKEVSELREQRKILELEISDYMKSAEYSGVGKIRNTKDGSIIKIQRPGTWSKAWHISKNDLKFHIEEYFKTTRSPNAEGCFQYVIDNQKNDLVDHTNFSYTRVSTDENVENK